MENRLETRIAELIQKIEHENLLFKNKSSLDDLHAPKKIVGRQDQIEQLVRFLHAPNRGMITPFVSVYGRSGSGKSTLVRFVCKNLEDLAYCFVNLRNAKTIFGCANLILAELDTPNLKSAHGLGLAVDAIEQAIISELKKQKKRSFVLVLDEFDMIFYDRRNNPSDFVYKLVILGENLRKKKYQLCIVGISNNVVSDYELDDRIRSRIGNSEVFFPPYTQDESLEILQDRSDEAFRDKVDGNVLQYCATLGAQDHGDARRVLDLLRIGSEIASIKDEHLEKSHIDLASARLQNDRVAEVMANGTNHFQYVCGAIAILTFLNNDWNYTSEIYQKYDNIIPSSIKRLSYRRVSEILVDVENTGLISSHTHSRGRKGYGTQYKLLFPPEMIGMAISKEWWNGIVQNKKAEAAQKNYSKMLSKISTGLKNDPVFRVISRLPSQ